MNKFINNLKYTYGFITVFFLWQILSLIKKDTAIPSLGKIFKSFFDLFKDNTFYINVYSSLEMITLGILVAILTGFILGILIFSNDTIKRVILPLAESIKGISALTLFPLLISTIGIGIWSRIIVICWTAFPSVLLSTIQALECEEDIINAAKLDGATNLSILKNIRIPLATNNILLGIRIAIGGGWIGLIAAEMLGATKGIGYYLLWSAQSFEYSKVYALIIVIAILGGLMNLMVFIIQKKLFKKIIGA